MISDPWSAIEPPSAATAIAARRVDERGRWDFFWGRDLDRRRLLLLVYRCADSSAKMPRPKGLDVHVNPAADANPAMLVWALADQAQAEIFYRLCLDIIAATVDATSEAEALDVAIMRTWRWHHLLRGGRDGRLSLEEQKGLIGELIVLERELIPRMPVGDAVTAWVGPLGTPKDFELGSVGIEAKARRGTAEPFVAISSEHQLDDQGLEMLLLHVTDLARSTSDTEGAFSLADLARRVADLVATGDPAAIQTFESTLAASGFSWSDDYSDVLWIETGTRLYRVVPGFPRIAAAQMAPGVGHVNYRISLVQCEQYAAEAGVLDAALNGATDAI